MSGHSKWSKIKHKKALKDQKRGVLFSKISKDITTAVREGGGTDPNKNFRLRMTLQTAKSANMPSDNIARAITRGRGGDDKSYEEVVYEGYGPAGMAIVICVQTDNRQRSAADLKIIFKKFDGRLGEPGSAVFLFDNTGDSFSPKVRIPIERAEIREKIDSMLSAISSLEGVKAVFCNIA